MFWLSSSVPDLESTTCPGTIEKGRNDLWRRKNSLVIVPASGLAVRASFPEYAQPFLEDGKNELGTDEIGTNGLVNLRLVKQSCAS